MLGEGLGEEEEEEDGSFTLLDVFVDCNIRPGEFGSPCNKNNFHQCSNLFSNYKSFVSQVIPCNKINQNSLHHMLNLFSNYKSLVSQVVPYNKIN